MAGAREELAATVRRVIFGTAVWRSVGNPPKDGTVTIVAALGQCGTPGLFRNGEWTNASGLPLPFKPTHWMDSNYG